MADPLGGEKRGAFHRFLVVSFEVAMGLVMALPRYSLCNGFKAWFLRCLGAKMGKRITFYPGVWITMTPGSTLDVGDDVDLAYGVIITASGGVTIGERTLVGYRTQILSANHRIPEGRGRIFGAGHDRKPVVIEKDVWIGANCLILPGVTVGEGAVVAGGSVVTKPVEPFTIVGGVPAKVISTRPEAVLVGQGQDGDSEQK
jgi:acetyltransferase-like isoleucine patch superfamily enzyme